MTSGCLANGNFSLERATKSATGRALGTFSATFAGTLGEIYEDSTGACAGCRCMLPRLLVGNARKAAPGGGGARFWRATCVWQGRVKLHPPCRRHTADFA